MTLKSRILRHLAVRGRVTVGARFHVGPGSVVWAPRSLTIGSDVYIGKHTTIEVDGEIGDGVLIANGVAIVGRDDHDISEVGSPIRRARWVGDFPDDLSHATHIGSDVWVGASAVVLSGITIGDSAIVGAGAVVTRDIPSNSIAVGNPARIVRQRFGRDDFERHWDLLRQQGFMPRTDGESSL